MSDLTTKESAAKIRAGLKKEGYNSRAVSVRVEYYGVDSGINVVVAGGNVSDVAMHFLEKYGILVTKILSKFELRRIARATGATMLMRYSAPSPEEEKPAEYTVGLTQFQTNLESVLDDPASWHQLFIPAGFEYIRGASSQLLSLKGL